MKPTFLDLFRRREGESDLEALTRPNPLLQDLPYQGPLQPVVEHLSRTVGWFDPHARSVPFSFIDPLEQLELGRMWTDPAAFADALGVKLEPWQRRMLGNLARRSR
jgi:hypothetical protein